MMSVLTENASSPLPQGFVAATMPKLNFLLLQSQDDELIKAATSSVKNMLEHDAEQVLSWRSEDGKDGLEVVLAMVARLLESSPVEAQRSTVSSVPVMLIIPLVAWIIRS